MNELTIIIDFWQYTELKEYLISINGISNVILKKEEHIEIYIKYNSNLITNENMKQIELNLNI